MIKDNSQAENKVVIDSDLNDIFYITDSEKERIMQVRAKELAVEPDNLEKTTGTLDVVEFYLAHERYGIESKWVKEVFPLMDLTPMPCTPSFILGITCIRGQIIPVTDIKLFFDLPSTDITNLNRLMIIRDENMTLGILADSIESVMELDANSIHECPGTSAEIRNDYLKGVTEEHLIVLDAKRLLSDPKLRINEDV